jgi:hypothetical protein
MLKTMKCECGKTLSFRALKRHLTENKKTYHSPKYVKDMLDFVMLNRKHRLAWLKSEGLDAIVNDHWGISVLSGETKLEDWTFDTPRPRGTVTPKTSQKMKVDRKGNGNPVNKTKPQYSLDELKLAAKEVWASVQEEDLRLNLFYKKMSEKLPFFAYSMSNMVPAKSFLEKGSGGHKNNVISVLLDIPLEELTHMRAMDRGKRIKKGQDNPKTRKRLLEVLKENRKNNVIGYVSDAQRKLHKLVQETIDSQAVLEKQIDYEETWKAFDVYSPLYDCFFEMHGHVWHDDTKCKPNMIDLVRSNMKNDKIKEKLAKNLGKKLFVFWDDQMHLWKKQIRNILKELQNENKENNQ